MKAKPTFTLLLTLAAIGCASDPPPKTPAPPKLDQERVTSIDVVRDAGYQTTSHRDEKLAGSGLNQEGYIHVLHDEPPNAGIHIEKTASANSGDLGADSTSSINHPTESIKNNDKGNLITINQDNNVRRAWERYCNAGEGMTEQDWNIIAQTEMPDDLRSTCLPPK